MWTEITRPKYARTGLRYASDLSDAEWRVIAPHMPPEKALGRPRTTDLREVGERHPVCFAFGLPLADVAEGVSAPFDDTALFRRVAGRRSVDADQSPSPDGGPRGGGARSQPFGRRHRQPERENHRKRRPTGLRCRQEGQPDPGRKRHILTDTGGLLVAARVHAANIQDRDGAPALLASIRYSFPWLRHVFADGAYAGPKLEAALKRVGRWTLEIVKRPNGAQGFEVLPRRWVVERTLAWLNRNRRLAKDFEAMIATAQAWLFIASVQLLTRRIVRY